VRLGGRANGGYWGVPLGAYSGACTHPPSGAGKHMVSCLQAYAFLQCQAICLWSQKPGAENGHCGGGSSRPSQVVPPMYWDVLYDLYPDGILAGNFLGNLGMCSPFGGSPFDGNQWFPWG